MKKNLVGSIVFILFSTAIFAQKSDTLQLNEQLSKLILPENINENSGLLFYNHLLFTFNDSGGKPEIYTFDIKTGAIKNTIALKNANNIDWEAITKDSTHIYVGDFGNNRGNRKDLTIYSIPIKEINFELELQEIESQKITFEIEGQTTFENLNRKNDFDIEAMVFWNDKLHFFTKEWQSYQTTHHVLDPKIKHQTSKKIESFPVGYCVTDASIDQNTLYLVGYTKESLAFLSDFSISNDNLFFKQLNQKTFIGFTPSIGQIEGVAATHNNLYISGEALKFGGFYHDQVLYHLTISK